MYKGPTKRRLGREGNGTPRVTRAAVVSWARPCRPHCCAMETTLAGTPFVRRQGAVCDLLLSSLKQDDELLYNTI